MDIEMTQDEVAGAVGLARETVNRHLKRFESSGAIQVSRGRLSIIDGERLSELADDL